MLLRYHLLTALLLLIVLQGISSAQNGHQLTCPEGAEIAGEPGVEQWCQVFQETEPPYLSHGQYKKWHPNGKLAIRGNFHEGLKTGEWITWDNKGAKIEMELWESGQLVSAKSFRKKATISKEKAHQLSRDNLSFAQEEKRRGNIGNAVAIANIALKYDPNYIEAQKFLREVEPLWHRQQEEERKALSKLEEKARRYYDKGNYLKAAVLYAKIHERDPKKQTEAMLIKSHEKSDWSEISNEEEARFLIPETLTLIELHRTNNLNDLVGHTISGLFDVVQVQGLGQALVKQHNGDRTFLIKCIHPNQAQFVFTKGRMLQLWLEITGYQQYMTVLMGQSGALTAEALFVQAY